MNIQLVTHNNKLLFVLFALFLFVACKPKEKPSPATSLTDDALMDTVQRRTFNYFWDAAEPNSGLARERYHMDGEYPAGGRRLLPQEAAASALWLSWPVLIGDTSAGKKAYSVWRK